jgi:hypothetical protein
MFREWFDKAVAYINPYLHIFSEFWFWNILAILALVFFNWIYSHREYRMLRKLFVMYEYNMMAAHVIMRKSGILTKLWIRGFVKGSERWFT